MAYFPDLSPRTYGEFAHDLLKRHCLTVGYLDGTHPFTKGRVDPRLIEKLKALAAMAPALAFGQHVCEVCVPPPDLPPYGFTDDGMKMIHPDRIRWQQSRRGNGEIRVSSVEVIFAAPVLIVHYIEEHQYLPPASFLEAVERA